VGTPPLWIPTGQPAEASSRHGLRPSPRRGPQTTQHDPADPRRHGRRPRHPAAPLPRPAPTTPASNSSARSPSTPTTSSSTPTNASPGRIPPLGPGRARPTRRRRTRRYPRLHRRHTPTTVERVVPDLHIVFDCADPDRLARFWMVALPGYDFPHGPPDGFATWQEWADANGVPRSSATPAAPWLTKWAAVPTSSSYESQRASSANQEPLATLWPAATWS
jgi:hypothetical protein